MAEREAQTLPPIQAVVFDLDGVLVDSERSWADSRKDVAARHGRTWTDRDEAAVKGANSREWSAAMRDRLGLPATDAEIERETVETMIARYRDGDPAPIQAGIEAARRLGARWPLAVASSAHPDVIRVALRAIGLAGAFPVVVSADEVGRGKPAPDVYLEVARRLGIAPEACLAIEDSPSGVEAAHSAGMRVVWVGGAAPGAGTRGREHGATVALESLDGLDGDMVEAISNGEGSAGG